MTLGDGLFETIKVTKGQPRHFHAHMMRLREGAAALAITIPKTDTAIAASIEELLVANALQDAAVRLTVSRGPAPIGVLAPETQMPTMLITASALPPAHGPVRAIIALSTRRNEQSPLARIKSLNYLDSIIARQEAERYGVDDALMLNTQGRLAEATCSNVFFLIDGSLVTPPVSDGALPGVVRADLIARFRGEELSLDLDHLSRAEEAFLCNAFGIRPLIDIAGQPIGDGAPGLVTQMLATRV